jgi:hypothetical protein
VGRRSRADSAWGGWEWQVQGLYELTQPGRFTPLKTGASQGRWLYPLHRHHDVAPDNRPHTYHSGVRSSSTPLTHGERRAQEQQVNDIAEVRALA